MGFRITDLETSSIKSSSWLQLLSESELGKFGTWVRMCT